MKLFLINPDYMKYGCPPLGLIAVAAYVRRECPFLEIKLMDQKSEEEIFKSIASSSPEVIAFTSVSENYYLVKKFAEKIKTLYPNIRLVLGGVHISTSPESFKDSPFDFAIRGEGEIAFTQLLTSLNESNQKNFKEIKGLMFRKGKTIINNGLSEFVGNLDNLPLPARDLLNQSYYKLPSITAKSDFDPTGMMITSRGCPYNCSFCSSYAMWNQRIHFFSAERVVKEIEVLYKKCNYRIISFVDDVFTINKIRLKEIISLLEKKNLLGKIKFVVMGRADSFDEGINYLEDKILFKRISHHGKITFNEDAIIFHQNTQWTFKKAINSAKKVEDFLRAHKKYNFPIQRIGPIIYPQQIIILLFPPILLCFHSVRSLSDLKIVIGMYLEKIYTRLLIWKYAFKNREFLI